MKKNIPFKYVLFRHIVLCVILVMSVYAKPNDGAFYGNGNHLIPITESQVQIKKEVLTITRNHLDSVFIQVKYEFYNPGKTKKVLMGFEAKSPSGDVNGTPLSGKHPYMSNFTVNVNGKTSPYEVAIINDSAYYQNKKFISVPESDLNLRDVNNVGFNYVYYFEQLFKNGSTFIEHNYSLKLSGSVDFRYYFNYVLTAANRWANKGIDDFTLILDMGSFQEFFIPLIFDYDFKNWCIEGNGIIILIESTPLYPDNQGLKIISRDGKVIFKKPNFQPQSELMLYAWNFFEYSDKFDPSINRLPFNPEFLEQIGEPINEAAQTILYHLPHARRGMVFNDSLLKTFYGQQSWYFIDSTYQFNFNELNEEEKNWLNRWK